MWPTVVVLCCCFRVRVRGLLDVGCSRVWWALGGGCTVTSASAGTQPCGSSLWGLVLCGAVAPNQVPASAAQLWDTSTLAAAAVPGPQSLLWLADLRLVFGS